MGHSERFLLVLPALAMKLARAMEMRQTSLIVHLSNVHA